MPLLTRFLAYYRPHRRLFLLDFSCAVASGLLELGFPVAVQFFIDRLLPGRDWGLILLASAGLLGVYLLLPVIKRDMKEYLADRRSGKLHLLGNEPTDGSTAVRPQV